jgi:pyruvate dehydrogenase E2 component (dihydrolipoamide acetyltransferase)
VATSVTMPQLGETVVEGTITKWLKKEGETVDRDEPLFEISTDKVDTEVPSPVAGKVVQIKVPEGETVQVGTELALIETDGQVAAAQPKQEAAEKKEQEEPKPAEEKPRTPPAEEERGKGPAEEGPAEARAPSRPAPPPPQRTSTAPAAAVETLEAPRRNILSPLVRRMAEEHQVDLSHVQGTGTGGRITKKDIQSFVETGGERPPPQPSPIPQPEPVPQPMPQPQPVPQPEPIPRPTPQPPPQPQPPVAAPEEVVPLSRMRQAIARNMVASIQTSARAWNLVEVNMENVARVREAAKESFREREGVSLTYMPFVARAVCEALLTFPDVNSELRGDQLVRKHYANLGIAVALDEGLIVPVVKGADTMNIIGLARAINDVATRARSKKLVPDDVQGGTFTITNPGPFGSIISVPIINPPQCGILAFDAVEKRPVVIDDAIAVRHMVYISMSWDHRIIDGATAAKFLARVKQNLETWDFGPEVGVAARGS